MIIKNKYNAHLNLIVEKIHRNFQKFNISKPKRLNNKIRLI